MCMHHTRAIYYYYREQKAVKDTSPGVIKNTISFKFSLSEPHKWRIITCNIHGINIAICVDNITIDNVIKGVPIN